MEMEETPAIDEVPTVAFVVALKRNVPPAVKATQWGEFSEYGCIELQAGGTIRLFEMKDKQAGRLLAVSSIEGLSGVADSTRYFFLSVERNALAPPLPPEPGVAIAFYSKQEMEKFMFAVNQRRQDGLRPKIERERSILMWETGGQGLAGPSIDSRRDTEEWEESGTDGDHEPFLTVPPKDMVARLEELKSKVKSGNRRKGRTQEIVITRSTPAASPGARAASGPPPISSSDSSVGTIKARDKKEEVGQFLRERCILLSGDHAAMEKIIAAVQSYGLQTTVDIGKRIMDDTLLELYPAVPVSIITLLVDFYTAATFSTDGAIYGEARGEVAMQEPPKLWRQWRKMLADIFFFFEYLYEEGAGPTSQWPSNNRRKGQAYRHDLNDRLVKEDKQKYDQRIAIRDTSNIIRAEILATLGMGSNIGTAEDMMKRLRSAQLTESQGAFMKKNVFQEEMKMLKRSYTEGRLSIDVMDALNEADSEEKAAGSSPNPGAGGSGAGVEEPFDEQILLDSCEGRSLETGQTDGDKQRPRAICVNDSSEGPRPPTPRSSGVVRQADLERVYSKLFEKAQDPGEKLLAQSLIFVSGGQYSASAAVSAATAGAATANTAPAGLSTVAPHIDDQAPLRDFARRRMAGDVLGADGRIRGIAMREESPMQDGELVVRFFGMKDEDSSLHVAMKVIQETIDTGPFFLKGKKNKIVSAKGGGSETRKMKLTPASTTSSWQCLVEHGVDLVDHIVARAGSDQTKRVVFTGHSMGAAIAAMVAYQAVVRYPVFRMRLYLVLLGSPRFARRTFTAWLNSELRYRILHITLAGDQVPKSPPVPPFFGWYTPGERLEINSGNLFVSKAASNTVHFQYWEVLRTLLAYD
ncbi:lipase [Acanthamoeba castellanii str. Neff]|uniref:Lipase n=1 Tax=Acanthamoeba castellanii (strain ATCC 30010 / Neff) TaxID=1257118 RepID=L8HKH4_ACACF|nr:lipase [Acanthamoeba castellanii str. Neff]ELR25727.1 lipase [Acanthamoeba castellanii str. Neff]